MLITDAYREQNAEMHRLHETYGCEGHKYAERIRAFARCVGTKDLLDYGAGKQTLKIALCKTDLNVRAYDPAIPELASRPNQADLVVCTDVLEHIEPECLGDVLKDIRGLAKEAAYFVVTITPATRSLPDGSNPHKLQKPASWWHSQLADAGFHVVQMRMIKAHKRYEFVCD